MAPQPQKSTDSPVAATHAAHNPFAAMLTEARADVDVLDDRPPTTVRELWQLSAGRKLERHDMTSQLVKLAEIVVDDVRKRGRYLDPGPGQWLLELAEGGGPLNDGAAKGVLNTVTARIRSQRKRWHRHNGTGLASSQCVVCGLTHKGDGPAWRNGIGAACWNRVQGGWS